MARKVIQIGDPVLLQSSLEVPVESISNPEIQALIDELLEICVSRDKETAGLSAVQIGELLRIYVIRRIDLADEGWEVLINPKIKVTSLRKSKFWEGCLSIGTGKQRLFGPVTRSAEVVVTYTDRNGVEKQLEAKDYMAHIVQHEQDHLDGVLFLQHISDPSLILTSGQLDEYAAEHGEYPPMG